MQVKDRLNTGGKGEGVERSSGTEEVVPEDQLRRNYQNVMMIEYLENYVK